MKKALEVAKEIAREYAQAVDSHKYKSITCKSIDSLSKEKFITCQRLEQLTIEAANPLSAVYAISQLSDAVYSNLLPRYLGESTPHFSMRAIWIHCDQHVAITEKVGVHLPSIFLNMKRRNFDAFCRRVIELGYNTVILGTRSFSFMEKSPVVFKELSMLIECFSDYGIAVVVKPNFYFYPDKGLVFSPLSEELQEKIKLAFHDFFMASKGVKSVFWRSLFDHSDFQLHPIGRNRTKEEKTQIELEIIERALPEDTQLIYYLPCDGSVMAQEQCQWLNNLVNRASKSTVFSFSSVAGDVTCDHEKEHPFWKTLRSSRVISGTPLMPIINTGGIDQGEGLWPSLPIDLLTKYLPTDSKHNFAGAIHLAPRIPKKGSLSDCAYWVASQVMWGRGTPTHLLTAWFEIHHPHVDIEKYLPVLKRTRKLIIELSNMRFLAMNPKRKKNDSQEVRLSGERMFAEFNEIEHLIAEWHVRSNSSVCSLKDYYDVFFRDAKKILAQYLQDNDISVSQSSGKDTKGEGFWSIIEKCKGEGLVLASKTKFLEKPLIGERGSLSHKIYWQSTIEDLVQTE
ncbi:MAG: hypothetical protein VX777_03885 [Chlamydiota bacterium]|nr:hypothetical protein [Chlamydiota bacterium]